MTFEDARTALPDIADPGTAFEIFTTVSDLTASDQRGAARELVIRILAQQGDVPDSLRGLLNGLVREHGLFPYLDSSEELSLADFMAYEIHRPVDFPDERTVFHAEQAEVYRHLLNGDNVVLSAPTSFGKSLVVDAILAARDFRNVVVIVPTIALIDETRRRLTRLSGKYKIITHQSQSLADRNLFVLTQERLPSVSPLPPIDFFVIDEFYKLDAEGPDDRADQLNVAFRQLLTTGAQFYLLGPNIASLASGVNETLRAVFFHTQFRTVATDVTQVSVARGEVQEHFSELLTSLDGQTLVYCRSPKRTRDVAQWLIDATPDALVNDEVVIDAADWLSEHFHPEWLVAKALRFGIGIHHGRLPRSIAHHMVRLFNSGRLRALLATSTLIEGVNTSAQNVIVLDNTIGNRKYDFFTYSNIVGRSGRMSRHFVGRVVIYNDAPPAFDAEVDVPVLTQPEGASDGILVHLSWDELAPHSRERMAEVHRQQLLSLETLRTNRGIRPELQLEVASQLVAAPAYWTNALTWRGGQPTAEQVRLTAPLLFTLAGSARMGGVLTSGVLSARLNSLRFHEGELGPLIEDQMAYVSGGPDEAVENVLDFMRQWAQFHVPRSLQALERIAREVLPNAGTSIRLGNYAGLLEGLFQSPFITVLEEYGLPMALSRRLEGQLGLRRAQTLDEVLTNLRELEAPPGLTPFEIDVLADVKDGL
ncbi:DEAD/DEAH box helicase [Blastococcus atacamensis]|uniref:DEAD/DEAH box helicase n=1 Tax=Blastococcus atacamensis TaxID=2070508 RepID=UPI0018E447C8|nr:DEAD/DEAH box helicase [Blastococcus atacamensis]